MTANLPVEVVSHILSFLNVSDRQDASLVSRTWYDASLDPVLQKDIVVNFFTSVTSDNLTEGLTRRKLTHLVLNHIDNSTDSIEDMVRSFEYLSDSLQSLSFKGCNLTEQTFVRLMTHCNNLNSLDLTSCNSLFMSGKILERDDDSATLRKSLANVKTLMLSSIRFLSDVSFGRLMSVCQNVEELSLAYTQITFNSTTYYAVGTKMGTNTSILTFQTILGLLERQGPKLKSLNLSRTTIGNCHLVELGKCETIHLEEVILSGCKEITDTGLAQFCRLQKELQRLDISNCCDITNVGIAAIATNLVKLQFLNTSKCKQMTDNSVKMFRLMKHLESLNFSECYQLFTKGMIQGLCSGIQSGLTFLNLNCCTNLTDYFVVELTKSLPNLLHLDLGSLFHITDISVHAVAKRLKHLKFLRLAWCKEISDKGLLGCEALDDSKYDSCDLDKHYGSCRCTRKFSDQGSNIFKKPTGKIVKDEEMTAQLEALIKDGGDLYSLQNLTGLRSLDLTACHSLTDVGLKEAIKFTELKSLSLGMVKQLTSESIIAIARNNPSLEDVRLNQCIHVTDEAIDVLTRKCPRLVHLDLSSCDRLTDHTVYYIQANCLRLRHLDVSFCSGMSVVAVEHLENGMKTLNTVHKRLVGNVVKPFEQVALA